MEELEEQVELCAENARQLGLAVSQVQATTQNVTNIKMYDCISYLYIGNLLSHSYINVYIFSLIIQFLVFFLLIFILEIILLILSPNSKN